jgi:ATP-dependent phosphoenolpyruvate carboxykinase
MKDQFKEYLAVNDNKKKISKEELDKIYDDVFKDREDFNLFVGKAFGGLKKFNVTKYKQLLKALVSHTTGKRKNEE